MPAPGEQLFDEQALAVAAEHHADSAYRWLTLSAEPEAVGLRAALEHCWSLAGDSRLVLRRGLAHERWGQHAGALAHLLALGLFAREGFGVTAEPDLDGRSPDLVATRGEVTLLVEVRAMTGCGLMPWERTEDLDEPTPEELASLLELPPPPPGDRPGRGASARRTPAAGHVPPATGGRRADARARARRVASERAAAERALAADLSASVARVLATKAEAYRELCEARDLPYVIGLYQDRDRSLGGLVRRWAYGPDEPPVTGGDAGAFGADDGRLAHVSAVVVFGREAGDPLLLRGELLPHPGARRPLPTAGLLPDLAVHDPRMTTSPPAPSPFPILPMRT